MIHEATLSDRPHFMRLYAEFQKDQVEQGSYFKPSLHNLNLAKGMFENYANGSVEGFTLLWTPQDSEEPVAFAMCGSDINQGAWELSLGKVCIMWGIYIQPNYRGQGITMKLFQRGHQIGLGLGYETVITNVLSSNHHGERVASAFGIRPVLIEYTLSMIQGMKTPEAREGLQRETT